MGWIAVLAFLIFYGYFNIPFTDALVFRIQDGWCVNSFRDGIGYHCFGDFGHPLQKGGFPSIYVPENIVSVNSPSIMAMFSLLTLTPYRVSLILYLGLGVVSCAAPFVNVIRGVSSHLRPILCFFGLFGTTGFIAAFDRANPIIFMPGLLWALYNSITSENWRKSSFLIILLSAIKFWAPIFVVSLLVRKKYRASLVVGVGVLSVYTLPMVLFDGGFRQNIQNMFGRIFTSNTNALFQPYSVSLTSLIRRLQCMFTEKSTCLTVDHDWGWTNSIVFNLACALSIVLAGIFIVKMFVNKSLIEFTALTAIPILAIPTAQVYNLVLIVPLVALLFRSHSGDQTRLMSKFSHNPVFSISIGLAASGIPLPIAYFGDSLFSSSNGEPPVFRLNYWSTPVIWTSLLVVLTISAFQKLNEMQRAKNSVLRQQVNRSDL